MAFRGAYLGPPGSMFMFAHARGEVSSTSSRKTTYLETLGGNLRAQVSPMVLREWSCSIPMAEQDEISHISGLISGLYGIGPFSWVPVTATMSNALTLSQSLPGPTHSKWSGGGVGVGAWELPGFGRVNHAVAAEPGENVVSVSPVCAGFPVTGSCYIEGGNLRVEALDHRKTQITSVSSESVPEGVVQRASASIGALPEGTCYVSITVANTSMFGLASLSWTPDLKPWVPGGGSNSVLVGGYGSSVFYLDPNESLEDIKFTVKELEPSA